MNDELDSKLPDRLPIDGGNAAYYSYGERFVLWNTEGDRVWLIRNTDSSTIGRLFEVLDGTYGFLGNKTMGVPNMDDPNRQPIVAFASVSWLTI